LSLAPGIGRFIAIIDCAFIFGRQKRCVHDLIAGTRVVLVNLPVGEAESSPSSMPPPRLKARMP
jgi:hypothetical protein